MKEITRDWIEIAKDDLETAQAMFDAHRYLPALFMCHQALEKLLKAAVTIASTDYPPRTHNLLELMKATTIRMEDETQKFLAKVNPFYIEARYAEYRKKVTALCDREFTKDILDKTDEVFLWLSNTIASL